jgi:hypothetical protein
VSLSRIKNNAENSIACHPFNKELSSEALVIEHSNVLDDGVEISYTLNSALKESRL